MQSIDNEDLKLSKKLDFSKKYFPTIALPFLLAQQVPYKRYYASVTSKFHQTTHYNTHRFYKPICII